MNKKCQVFIPADYVEELLVSVDIENTLQSLKLYDTISFSVGQLSVS